MAISNIFSCVLFCCCFITTIQGIEHFPERNFLSRTYFDFLNDVSAKVQRANGIGGEKAKEHTEIFIHNLYHTIFQPLEKLFKTEQGKDLFVKRFIQNRSPPHNGTGLGDNNNNYSDVLNEGDDILQHVLGILQDLHNNIDGAQTTSVCISDTIRLISGFLSGEPWAFQFFDSAGKPGPALSKMHLNFVGDYDQCRAAKTPSGNISSVKGHQDFDGNYCVVGLYAGMPYFVPQIGLCLPSTCNSEEIASFMNILINMTSLNTSVVVECRAAKTEVTTATIFAIIILSIIGVLIILGTSYDLFVMSTKVGEIQVVFDENNQFGHVPATREADTNVMNKEESPLLLPPEKKSCFRRGPSNGFAKVLLAFSVYSNAKKMLDTSQAQGTLGAIHGIRFFSMSWVVMCHVFANLIVTSENNVETMPKLLHRWTFIVISNGFVSVDTFFTISGLLTSYLTIKEMSRKKSWIINWTMFYFHRFWRLTPPYMFSIVIALGLTQYLGDGPLWSNAQPNDKSFCEKNWWTNLLYVNNLVNTKEMCFGHSWYLANDMQFFVLSPLMLIPFYFNGCAGIFSCLGFLLITTMTTGILSTENDWPTTMVSLKPPSMTNEWFEDYYIKPWCRIGPFIVGVLAGYFLSKTRGRHFQMPKFIVMVGWMATFACGSAVVYGIRGDITGEDISSDNVSAFYNATNRTAWGACVCWIIIACSAGYGGPIQAFLSWSPFVFLGRLTYMTYLIHPCIVGVFFQSLGALLYVNNAMLVIIYIGILFFVNMVAFVFVLALESPMLGLEKAFIKKERNV